DADLLRHVSFLDVHRLQVRAEHAAADAGRLAAVAPQILRLAALDVLITERGTFLAVITLGGHRTIPGSADHGQLKPRPKFAVGHCSKFAKVCKSRDGSG